jgi:uncharacterized protein (TIGR02391 family)
LNLSTTIDSGLWASIQNAYENGNYTSAILDSIHYLSQVIRNKSGLESDGHVLVGNAFGGANPIIKVNGLSTDSEKDEQRGIEFLLRGLYTAIRNPRSHDKYVDTNEVADIIISFVNYLLRLIDKSRSPFDKHSIVDRVFEKHFAQNDKYSDLLVQRVPGRKRLETLLDVFARRSEGSHKNIAFFSRAVLRTLSTDDQAIFWEVVSESLERASSDLEFRAAIQVSEHQWSQVSEIARLRTENRLIESVKEGEYDEGRSLCLKGLLGTWVKPIAADLMLHEEYVMAVTKRLRSVDVLARAYVLKFHLECVHRLRPTPPPLLSFTLRQRLLEHDEDVHEALMFLVLEPDDSGWVVALKKTFDDFVANAVTDDDIPF